MGTVSIPLTQGKVAIIDEEDLPLVSGRSWYAAERQYTWYAATGEMRGGRLFIVLMHRLLANAPNGSVVDHKDHNGLNNCRSNIRLTVQSFNAVNTGPRSRNTTGFKGVGWDKTHKKYKAQITFKKKNHHLGRYDTPEEAARAYDAKAREWHGDFARLNFP